jgi:hypothetical protein
MEIIIIVKKLIQKYTYVIRIVKEINNYITFLIYNAKISDNNAESGKVP